MLSSSAPTSAQEYLLVGKNVYFYSDTLFDASESVFILPSDYYVAILEEADVYYKVSYQTTKNGYIKLTGFIEKDNVEKKSVNYPLYPNITVAALKNTALYNDKLLKSPVSTILSGQRVSVYGTTENPSVAFCVFGNETGYISTAAFEYFEIPKHLINTEKPQEIAPESEKNDENPTFSENSLPASVQTLLFVFIAIPVFLLTFLLFSVKSKDK